MARTYVSDELWEEVKALLPPERPKPKGGRPTIPARQCLVGIVFLLRTGCGWRDIPYELVGGSGVTCWRRFHEWTEAGVWPELWRRLLNHLGRLLQVDLSRAVIDSASVRAVSGGTSRGRIRRTVQSRAASAI